MQTAIFDTSAYVNSHGKAPCGYGTWAFEVSGRTADGKKYVDISFVTESYSNAQCRIRFHINDLGIARATVKVLP